MLADFGVPVICDGVTTTGIPRLRSELVLAGQGPGSRAEFESVLVQRGVLPALEQDVALTVDGVAYTAREVLDESLLLVRVLLEA